MKCITGIVFIALGAATAVAAWPHEWFWTIAKCVLGALVGLFIMITGYGFLCNFGDREDDEG